MLQHTIALQLTSKHMQDITYPQDSDLHLLNNLRRWVLQSRWQRTKESVALTLEYTSSSCTKVTVFITINTDVYRDITGDGTFKYLGGVDWAFAGLPIGFFSIHRPHISMVSAEKIATIWEDNVLLNIRIVRIVARDNVFVEYEERDDEDEEDMDQDQDEILVEDNNMSIFHLHSFSLQVLLTRHWWYASFAKQDDWRLSLLCLTNGGLSLAMHSVILWP